MKKILLISLLLAVHSSNSMAYYEIGNELREGLEAMEKNQSSFESGFAAGFITGVADTGDKVLFCIPQEASGAQLAAIVMKYFRANPEEWNKSAAKLVINALKPVFPCTKAGTDKETNQKNRLEICVQGKLKAEVSCNTTHHGGRIFAGQVRLTG